MATVMRTLQSCRRSFLFNPKRCSSIVAIKQQVVSDDQQSLYPPIKPKYPPGSWGGMEPRYAWIWHHKREKILTNDNVEDRKKYLCAKGIKQVKYNVNDQCPRTLPYKLYVTKTRLVQGLPDIYKSLDQGNLDSLTARLTPLICDLIVMETEQVERKGYLSRVVSLQHDTRLAHVLVSNILQNLMTHMSDQFPHLLTAQYDEDVHMAAAWDRKGFNRIRHRYHPKFTNTEVVDDICFTGETNADFVLRATKPLPQFAEHDKAPCVGETVSHLGFNPVTFGQKFAYDKPRSFEAGYVWGDPCEFGLMSVHLTHWSNFLSKKFGPHHAQDARLGQGIGASFLWLVAQAVNQGFSTYVDVTYPLTTQTVLTSGKKWQFLTYQLNTLALWLDDEANELVNVCWTDEEKELYAGVEGGKVCGFNPDVLRQLIAYMALAPADRHYNLRPTLPADAPTPSKEKFIPEKKEEVIVVEEEKYVV